MASFRTQRARYASLLLLIARTLFWFKACSTEYSAAAIAIEQELIAGDAAYRRLGCASPAAVLGRR